MKSDNIRVTAAVVAAALFMQNIDSTAVSVALPAMSRDLHVPVLHLSATITAYLVALTVFIPVSGWVADRFGAKRVFLWAIAIFTASSALCAVSGGVGSLVSARVLQGMGGAMMLPVGRLLLFRRAKREELLTATTWMTTPALLGPMLGPPLGGFLTDVLNWQSVFWINVPVGVTGLALAWRLIPEPPPESPAPPDLRGMALIGVSLTLLMVGLETAGRALLPPGGSPVCAVLGLALGWAAVRHCRRAEHPAVDFSLLRIPTFYAASVPGSLFRIGAGALPFLVPLMLQLGFGLSASASGLVSLASALGTFSTRPMAKFVLAAWRVRSVLIGGGIAFAAFLAICATLSPAWPLALLFAWLAIGGVSRSVAFATLGAVAFADVPQPRMSAATSLQGTLQQMVKAVGVTVAAGAMQATLLLSGRAQATRLDFAVAFVTLALIVLASAPLFATLDRDAGDGIGGRFKPRPRP